MPRWRAWWERDPVLWQGEQEAMAFFFPSFVSYIDGTGRLCWDGWVAGEPWFRYDWRLLARYGHDHPNRSDHVGSVQVYSVQPELRQLAQRHGNLPHVLIDGDGIPFLCTVAADVSFKTGSVVTSAASVLSWGAKWVYAAEACFAGAIDERTWWAL